MKTLTKKILTVCLTLAMACALAIPAFADFDMVTMDTTFVTNLSAGITI